MKTALLAILVLCCAGYVKVHSPAELEMDTHRLDSFAFLFTHGNLIKEDKKVLKEIEAQEVFDAEVFVINLDKPELKPLAEQYAVDYDYLPFFLMFDYEGPAYGETLTFETADRVGLGSQIVPTLIKQQQEKQDMLHKMDFGQGVNMMDLKPIKDEIAEEHQRENEQRPFDIDDQGNVEADNGPLTYLGTFVENEFPKNEKAIPHFYRPDVEFYKTFDHLIPQEDEEHHYAYTEWGDPLVHVYYDQVVDTGIN